MKLIIKAPPNDDLDEMFVPARKRLNLKWKTPFCFKFFSLSFFFFIKIICSFTMKLIFFLLFFFIFFHIFFSIYVFFSFIRSFTHNHSHAHILFFSFSSLCITYKFGGGFNLHDLNQYKKWKMLLSYFQFYIVCNFFSSFFFLF